MICPFIAVPFSENGDFADGILRQYGAAQVGNKCASSEQRITRKVILEAHHL